MPSLDNEVAPPHRGPPCYQIIDIGRGWFHPPSVVHLRASSPPRLASCARARSTASTDSSAIHSDQSSSSSSRPGWCAR